MKNPFFKTVVLFSFLFVIASCDPDDEPVGPTEPAPTAISQTTTENVEATYTTIKINGIVSPNGGSEILSRGICWSTDSNPTIDGFKTTETTNEFTSTASDLIANTPYYFRVYATNSSGTTYAPEQSFSTSSLDDTMWDFTMIHDSTTFWHADVDFYADGTTKYDEPDNPGTYLHYGTWSLDGNTLTYTMDSTSTNTSYIFTGTLSTNTMVGTYTYGPDNKYWTATEY